MRCIHCPVCRKGVENILAHWVHEKDGYTVMKPYWSCESEMRSCQS